MDKICINCKHCVIPEGDRAKFARCNYNNPISLVTGELEISELMFCQVLRTSHVADHCGAEGKFYEEKTNV
jgi:hypothetical protein